MIFFEVPASNSFWAGSVPAIIGALIGGGFVILALLLQQRSQEIAAVRALILEMLHNAVIINAWTRAASEQPVPQFPVLSHSVFDEQLTLIAKRLGFKDLVAILQAYTAVFVLAPGMESLKGLRKLSAENVQHSRAAAEKFFGHSRTLSARFLTRKERKDAEPFFASATSRFAGQPPPGA